jgi:Peptidase family M50
VGTYGTITPLATFPKSRQQLFDVSVAGPIVGASLSLIALIAGLTLTGGASAEALAAFPVVPAALFHSSALIGGVTTLALPTVMLQVCATDCCVLVASTSSVAVACSVWQASLKCCCTYDVACVSFTKRCLGSSYALSMCIRLCPITLHASPSVLQLTHTALCIVYTLTLLLCLRIRVHAALQALSAPIPIHPLTVVGLTGVVINALNMMPIGRLDGGRAASAVFGRRTAAVLGTLTLLLQAISAIFNNYSLQVCVRCPHVIQKPSMK